MLETIFNGQTESNRRFLYGTPILARELAGKGGSDEGRPGTTEQKDRPTFPNSIVVVGFVFANDRSGLLYIRNSRISHRAVPR